jgi:hypothetical protein
VPEPADLTIYFASFLASEITVKSSTISKKFSAMLCLPISITLEVPSSNRNSGDKSKIFLKNSLPFLTPHPQS